MPRRKPQNPSRRDVIEDEQEEEDEEEEEKEDESGGKTVGTTPRPSRKKRRKMIVEDAGGGHGNSTAQGNGDGRHVGGSAVPGESVGGVVVRSLPVETGGTLQAVPGLCIVVSIPPSTGKAALIRTPASGTEEELTEAAEAQNRASRNWGIAVETVEGCGGTKGSTASRTHVGMLRVIPEVVSAIEDLNRDGFIAITTSTTTTTSMSASWEDRPKEGCVDDPLEDESIDANTYPCGGGGGGGSGAVVM